MNTLKVICCFLFVVITLALVACRLSKESEIEKMDYREDVEQLTNRFSTLDGIESCFWKADTIGKTNFGPTNYWMKGFLCLDENNFQKILTEYEWIADDIVFPNGIDPDITGKDDFSWHINKDFQSMILRQSFVGSIYFDITNGIVYFDVENN